jgi:hypothetical protein
MKLRTLIRQLIAETLKNAPGWENYDSLDRSADNNKMIDSGYAAAYHRQYHDAIHNNEELNNLERGGLNVVSKKKTTKSKKNA